jgi:superfamily I DNA and/or RNA helicase
MIALEEIPTIIESAPTQMATNNATNKKRKLPATKPSKTKQSEKQRLVQRYLENFDAKNGIAPTHDEVKRMSTLQLKDRLKLIEVKHTVSLKPTGLAERVISLVSAVLDTLLQTESEIQKVNESDDELRRAVQSELGSLATYLNNKVQILSHVALNTGKVVLKKRKIDKEFLNKEKDTDGRSKSKAETHIP